MHHAAEIACDNIPEFPGPVLPGLDTSGSMISPITGNRGRGATSRMRCVDVVASFAAAILRRIPESVVVPSNNPASPWQDRVLRLFLSSERELLRYAMALALRIDDAREIVQQPAVENGSSLLDRTMVLYGTCMGDANTHSNVNLPVLLAGGGFRHGQHLAFDTKNNYPLANLFVSMLQRLGLETGKFASSTSTMRVLDLQQVSSTP